LLWRRIHSWSTKGLKEWELEKVARFANAVGALAVTKKGPMEGAPFLDEVNEILAC